MFSFITSFLPNLPEWLTLDANPLESLLQGVVGACGVSILCNLLRVHLFLESERNEDSSEDTSSQKKSSHQGNVTSGIGGTLQFWFLTGIISVVGSRVTSLVVLEFSLRAVSAWFTAGPESKALRFWTPLTICYTLLVVYMQEDQHRQASGQAVLNTVGVRLGGLMVLMLTIGRWADVFHIFMCFLGEAGCLIPTTDLLDATSQEDEQFSRPDTENWRIQKTTSHKR
ncbi:transmembrane protein 82 isoform X2 [Hypomesus transpacificus]|uniref:transmembrane protein 82 isoform X2 n=1 Tax=Hypomesus transpacificus TaxID=137520 RepID=UPI001F07E66E|nr:transmembrane protein 82 isoform X2 [Hypomesus transpacificus]